MGHWLHPGALVARINLSNYEKQELGLSLFYKRK